VARERCASPPPFQRAASERAGVQDCCPLHRAYAPWTARCAADHTGTGVAEGRDGPTYEYDVALSCAPEDAVYVAQVAGQLQERGVRIFFEFDDHRIAEDWGRDLQVLFDEVFRKRARFAMPFVSTHYARRLWSTLQHRSAQARALFEDDAYVLPVRLDDTELAGLRPTIRCLVARQMTVARLVELFLEKLHASALPTAPPVPALRAAAAMAGPSSVQAERIGKWHPLYRGPCRATAGPRAVWETISGL